MRTEILQSKNLSRTSNESINDSDNIAEIMRSYDKLLERIQLPISSDKAEVLVQIFPESSFYNLQRGLLKLVESVMHIGDGDKYIQLINARPSQEWKGVLNIHYKNYRKENVEF